MDFRLINYCDHKVLNEEIVPTVQRGYTMAFTKRPIVGNNGTFYILDSNNLFKPKETRVEIKASLTDDPTHKNILFLEPVVTTKTYPLIKYYITYTTSQSYCPRCQENKTWDMSIDALGKVKQISGMDKLVQQVKKALSTNLERNYFNLDYGSDIPKLIGKPNNVVNILLLQNAIQNVESFIKNQQSQDSNLEASEKLLSFEAYELLPSENEKKICFQFSIRNYQDETETIQLEV